VYCERGDYFVQKVTAKRAIEKNSKSACVSQGNEPGPRTSGLSERDLLHTKSPLVSIQHNQPYTQTVAHVCLLTSTHAYTQKKPRTDQALGIPGLAVSGRTDAGVSAYGQVPSPVHLLPATCAHMSKVVAVDEAARLAMVVFAVCLAPSPRTSHMSVSTFQRPARVETQTLDTITFGSTLGGETWSCGSVRCSVCCSVINSYATWISRVAECCCVAMCW